ncbi:MAG: MerR family transcriptional regulator [Chloroflexota bacterium]|nr:MerR family transcriptional regulator [Chloroflexota bacterium]
MERRTRRIHIRSEVVFPADAEGRSRLPVPADAPTRGPREDEQPVETLGVYVISVTARILRMHPQTLRKYERLGLVRPSRSEGMVRYYSDQDLNRLRMIKYLVEERGMNLAGVELALEMVARLQGMQRALEGRAETGAAAALEGHVQSVLEMLHYAERDSGPAASQEHPDSLRRTDAGPNAQRP